MKKVLYILFIIIILFCFFDYFLSNKNLKNNEILARLVPPEPELYIQTDITSIDKIINKPNITNLAGLEKKLIERLLYLIKPAVQENIYIVQPTSNSNYFFIFNTEESEHKLTILINNISYIFDKKISNFTMKYYKNYPIYSMFIGKNIFNYAIVDNYLIFTLENKSQLKKMINYYEINKHNRYSDNKILAIRNAYEDYSLFFYCKKNIFKKINKHIFLNDKGIAESFLLVKTDKNFLSGKGKIFFDKDSNYIIGDNTDKSEYLRILPKSGNFVSYSIPVEELALLKDKLIKFKEIESVIPVNYNLADTHILKYFRNNINIFKPEVKTDFKNDYLVYNFILNDNNTSDSDINLFFKNMFGLDPSLNIEKDRLLEDVSLVRFLNDKSERIVTDPENDLRRLLDLPLLKDDIKLKESEVIFSYIRNENLLFAAKYDEKNLISKYFYNKKNKIDKSLSELFLKLDMFEPDIFNIIYNSNSNNYPLSFSLKLFNKIKYFDFKFAVNSKKINSTADENIMPLIKQDLFKKLIKEKMSIINSSINIYKIENPMSPIPLDLEGLLKKLSSEEIANINNYFVYKKLSGNKYLIGHNDYFGMLDAIYISELKRTFFLEDLLTEEKIALETYFNEH